MKSAICPGRAAKAVCAFAGGEIQTAGRTASSKVDVRIIAATNTDLEEDGARAGSARICTIAERESGCGCALVGKGVPRFPRLELLHQPLFGQIRAKDIQIKPQAVDLLMVSEWPGNVRQLCNEIQRIVARAEDGTTITPEQLSPELKRTSSPATPTTTASPGFDAAAALQGGTLADALAEVERRMIADALRRHAAYLTRRRELRLTRRGLYLKLERHDLSASA